MADDQDVIRVDVLGDFDATEDIGNTYQFRLTDVGGLTDTLELEDLEELIEALYTLIKVILTTAAVIRKFKAYNVTQGTILGEVILSPAIAGTSAGDSSPAGVCSLASFPTNVPRVVGRKFYGPVTEAQIQNEGEFGSGHITSVNAIITQLTTTYNATSGSYNYGYQSPKTGAFELFTQGESHIEPAYQRRRRRGTGS